MNRIHVLFEDLDVATDEDCYDFGVGVPVSEEKANLVTSALPDGQHAPAIDIDLPCALVPSSTEGHFHLYIDKAMPWRKYKRLLKSLMRAEIVQRGFYKATVHRGASYLRKPGVKKPAEEPF